MNNLADAIQERYIRLQLDSEDNIVWLPGIKKSKFDKKNEERYDIIFFVNTGKQVKVLYEPVAVRRKRLSFLPF